MPIATFDETMNQLELLFRAGCPLIYLITHEETRALECLGQVVHRIKRGSPHKRLYSWDSVQGTVEHLLQPQTEDTRNQSRWLRAAGLEAERKPRRVRQPTTLDAAWQSVCDAGPNKQLSELADSVLTCFDAHPQLGFGGQLVRPLRKAVAQLRKYNDDPRERYAAEQGGGQRSKTIVVVTPGSSDPSSELERDIIRIRLPLPEQAELLLTLNEWIQRRNMLFEAIVTADPTGENRKSRPSTDDERRTLLQLIAGAGRGLTLDDYQLGLQKMAARGQSVGEQCVKDMLDLKAQVVSNPALSYTPHVDVELGGLHKATAWMKERRDAAVSEEVRRRFQLPPPRGVMLCGASGGGKSQLAKLVAKVFNLALLRLDVGSLFGQYQGEAEQRTRDALEMAEVLAPVVLWIDELDKAFKNAGNAGDSGVSARVVGYLLTWLSEKQDTVFVVATANNHQDLLKDFPEFGRKGRFDQVFWINVPSAKERKEILRIYLRRIQQQEGTSLRLDLDPALIRRSAEDADQPLPTDSSPLEQMCTLLANSHYSQDMTGAEIEYAITEAKYDVYNRWVGDERPERAEPLTPDVLCRVFLEAKKQAVLKTNSTAREKHDAAEADAEVRGWPFINEIDA